MRDGDAIIKAMAALPDLDVLVSTPAINVRKPLLDLTDEEFDLVISLNLKGTFRLITAAGRNMKKRGKGSIIAFASIRAITVEPGQGVYAATKAGVLQMCRTLAAELAPHGVRSTLLGPVSSIRHSLLPSPPIRSGITLTHKRALSDAGLSPTRWPALLFISPQMRLLRHRNPHHRRWRLDHG